MFAPDCLARVILVAPSVPRRKGKPHRAAAFGAVQETGERRELWTVNLPPLARAAQRKLGVDLVPNFFVDNPLLLA